MNFSEIKQIFKDPMGLMLLTLGLIYLLVGQTTDAIVLFISFIPVTAVDVLLEIKAKKALDALRATLKPTAKTLSHGLIKEVPIEDIVPGDVIVFEEGQNLPVDGIISECEHLQINEAALTGESVPVDKVAGDPFFGGTFVLQGNALGLVEKIGRDTKFGKIAELLEETESETSPLKKKVNGIIRKVILIAILVAFILFIVTYFKNHNFVHSLIEALTFGMAAIPEEFPLVFTLYLSLGAYRLSKHGVLVKSLPSVEALGGVDIICTDKTGTLTEGIFQMEKIEAINTEPSEETLWQKTLMSCEVNPVDAMETAIFQKGNNFKSQLIDWSLIYDYPFEVKGKHMSHVWKNKTSNQTIIVMKGSVEGILEHCSLSPDEKKIIEEKANHWSSKGKRLLGLASRSGVCEGIREKDETDLNFLGLLIFTDPIRESARAAILKCQKHGITVKMLTGDHPLTAHAIADDLGLIHSHEYLYTGNQLSQMTQEERYLAYDRGAIFSRVLPEQKFEMVTALKSMGKIVAMTGDGINDAPALKTADIGISMGENATDVARKSAQMVLMKNDFKGIIEAVFEGRKIFSNLKRSFSYLISFHVPIVFFALLPPLFGYGNLLLPIHIVLLELIVHPISAFSFENLPANESINEKSLMSMRRFFESLLSGVLLSLGSLYLYQSALLNNDIIIARSAAIATIMFGNIFFVFLESWPQITQRFIYTTLLLLAFIFILFYVPTISNIFYLSSINIYFILWGIMISFLAALPTFIFRLKKN